MDSQGRRVQRLIEQARRLEQPVTKVIAVPGRAVPGAAYPDRPRRRRMQILEAAQAIIAAEA